jgi:hypothetical protein
MSVLPDQLRDLMTAGPMDPPDHHQRGREPAGERDLDRP